MGSAGIEPATWRITACIQLGYTRRLDNNECYWRRGVSSDARFVSRVYPCWTDGYEKTSASEPNHFHLSLQHSYLQVCLE